MFKKVLPYFFLVLGLSFLLSCDNSDDTQHFYTENPILEFLRFEIDGKEFYFDELNSNSRGSDTWTWDTSNVIVSRWQEKEEPNINIINLSFQFQNLKEVTESDILSMDSTTISFKEGEDISAFFSLKIDSLNQSRFNTKNIEGNLEENFIEIKNVTENGNTTDVFYTNSPNDSSYIELKHFYIEGIFQTKVQNEETNEHYYIKNGMFLMRFRETYTP